MENFRAVFMYFFEYKDSCRKCSWCISLKWRGYNASGFCCHKTWSLLLLYWLQVKLFTYSFRNNVKNDMKKEFLKKILKTFSGGNYFCLLTGIFSLGEKLFNLYVTFYRSNLMWEVTFKSKSPSVFQPVVLVTGLSASADHTGTILKWPI